MIKTVKTVKFTVFRSVAAPVTASTSSVARLLAVSAGIYSVTGESTVSGPTVSPQVRLGSDIKWYFRLS